jgi:UDP-N-acetylmuramate dehydrogenase
MISKNQNLQAHNTFGIQAKANCFARFQSVAQLASLLNEHIEPLLILGGGSNILLTKDFEGTVLKNEINGIDVFKEDEDFAFVKVGAGVVWHDFVMWAIDNNLGGAENMSLIPGSVGAAPMQNIGAYGVELKSIFHELEALSIDKKELHTFSNSDCDFGYRYSIFKGPLKDKFVISSVSFRLQKKHSFNTSYGAIEEQLQKMSLKPNLKNISDAVIAIRQQKLPDPKKIGNSGSFFKNPVINNEKFQALKKQFPEIVGYPVSETHTKVAAGWLIDQAGWKGYQNGDAGVHKNQALVLVNYGNAKGSEIWQLSEQILQSISEKYGIVLEREVNII